MWIKDAEGSPWLRYTPLTERRFCREWPEISITRYMEVRKTTGIRTTCNKLMTNLNTGDRFESEMNKPLGSALRKYDDREL